jgi:hypothetical protein
LLAMEAKKVVGGKVVFLKEYDRKFVESQKQNEILFREMREEKAHLYQLEKEYEATHKANMILRDPYKTKISQESLQGTFLRSQPRRRAAKA